MTAVRRVRPLWQRIPGIMGGYLGLLILVGVVASLALLRILPEQRWAPLGDVRILRFLLQGLGATLQIGAVALVASLLLSLPLALARLNLPPPFRWVVIGWIELVRATPVLALILLLVLFMPRTGIIIPDIWAATLGLTIYTSAVLAEIVRAGILSISKGEVEAARSLGLSYPAAMRYVVLPQAISRMAPAIVSQLITLVKDTSLASVAAVQELVGHAEVTYNRYGNIVETLFVVACIYFVVCYTLSRVARRLEARQPVNERVVVTGEADQVAAATDV